MDERVLIADNAERWRDTLEDMLFDLGLEFDQVPSAAEALEKLGQHPYRLTIVDAFLDQASFDQLSLKLIQHIYQQHPKTTVVVVSERELTNAEREQLRDLNVVYLWDKAAIKLQEVRQEVDTVMHSFPYRVFITYRREDGQAFSAILHRILNERLGPRSAFMDIYDIEGGATWDENIRQIIPGCRAMIVVIGKQWMALEQRHRATASHNPQANDYIKIEVEIALRQKIKVIPVLIQNASMPSRSDEMPPWLAELTNYQAVRFPDLRRDSATVDEILKNLHFTESV